MVGAYLNASLTFFGHTHVQGGFLFTRRGIKRIAPEGVLELEPDHRYLLNPGLVGQPRDLNPKAAYALYTPENRTVEFRRVRYDVAGAAPENPGRGPTQHAGRAPVCRCVNPA
jgi:diadenosine tetraphosphatase ApaH/serine/threonine PP2A family protein phosphatase